MIDLAVLEIMVIISGIFVPLHFWLRRRMTQQIKHENSISYYTKRRITHFFLLTMAALVVCFIINLSVLLGIKSRNSLNFYSYEEIFVIIVFIITWIFIASGFGLYISGVFVEQYSMYSLKILPEYSRLKIATIFDYTIKYL